MSNQWLGLDIGGANIKVADGDSYARIWPFALWRSPDMLAEQLRSVLAVVPDSAAPLAVTMTGELADCFESKAHGVASILESLQNATVDRKIRVFSVNAEWLSVDDAVAQPREVAASNWMLMMNVLLMWMQAPSRANFYEGVAKKSGSTGRKWSFQEGGPILPNE